MPTDDETSGQAQSAPLRFPIQLRPTYVLIAIFALLVVFSLAVWGIQAVVEAGKHKATRRTFAQVAVSLINYTDVRGHLPWPTTREKLQGQSTCCDGKNGTGRPLYSWRVEIVCYLEAWHRSWDPSEPWDDPANKHLVELSAYYAYEAAGPEGHPQSFPETNLLAITGPGTAFGDGKEPPKALKDISPDTILAVETRASGIPWPAPGDFDIRNVPHTINAPDGQGISSRSEEGFHLIFADGRVWFLSDDVPFETLEKFFTIAGAKKHDREKLLGPFALHRGP